MKNWSTYQKSIFNHIANSSNHLGINALAGAGKTSTITEGLKYVPKGKKVLMLAFNRIIVNELREKIQKSYVDIYTLHSLGFKSIKNLNSKVIIDEKKMFNIIKPMVGDDFDLISSLCKCVSMCKNTLSMEKDKIKEIIGEFDFETFDLSIDDYTNIVYKSLEICKEDIKVIDFDDMIWLPVVHKMSIQKYDYVFTDESQDINRCQTLLIFSAAKKESKIVFVYDINQTLYRFRGADPEVINTFTNVLKADTLSLPITYRCPKKIVYDAQKIVPSFTPSPTAINGEIYNILEDDLIKYIKPGDFLLSRTNAPLIKWCMFLLKNKIPTNIQGRDVGESLRWFVKKSKKKTIKSLISYVNKWRDEQIYKFKDTKKDISMYQDKAECLLNLCEEAKDINDLNNLIKKLFEDKYDSKRVILSTVHRAKGLEKDNVFLLKSTFRYHPGVVGDEANIMYVAISRAKKNLYYVRPKDKHHKYDGKSSSITF